MITYIRYIYILKKITGLINKKKFKAKAVSVRGEYSDCHNEKGCCVTGKTK